MNTKIHSTFFKILFCGFLWIPLAGVLNGQTITRPTISGPNGLSVNSYTGNLFHQRTDMVIPGQGLSIDATFSFNTALDTLDWGLGFGWTFTYNMLYRTDSLGIKILRMDGREDLFILNNNVYTSPTGVFDKLEEYQTGKFRLTNKYGLKYFFDDTTHKKLTKIEDLNNNVLTLTYSGGYISSVTNTSGRSLNFNWSSDHLVEIEDNNLAASRIISYVYEDGLLTSVTDPEGNTMTYTYDEQVLLTQMTDKNGNPVSIIYHPTGQVKEFVSCESSQKITYHEDLTFIVEQSSAGNLVTVFNFDEEGRVVSTKNPSGGITAFKYDNHNNLIEFTDYAGNKSTYTYDNEGNRTSVTNPLGHQTLYTYTTYNRLESFTDERGNVSTYTYDVSGNLTNVSRPLGSSENYIYDTNGNLIQITDGNSNATNFNYDAAGNLESIDYPVGSINYEYNAVGNITKIIDALLNETIFTYNSLNQLTSIEDALHHTTTFIYDANGNLLTETDANDNIKMYAYDPLNRLISVTIPAGVTYYKYDAIGNLLKITDANGNSTQFTYNNQNLVTSEIDALGNSTFYTYDANGNLVQKTDANGHVTTYSYDVLNRLLSRVYPENSDYYNYDAIGNLTHAINNNISISYTYDALSRLDSKTIDTWNKTIQYSYDNAGNRATMSDPDNGLTSYIYDSNNRLTNLTNPLSQETTFEYDIAGRITQQNNANGTFATYTYDDRSNLLNLTNAKSTNEIISSYTYTYDDFGNRLTMTDLTGTHFYTYDDNYRLTDVIYANGDTESFTYDGAGNRLQLQKNGVPTNYTYNTTNQILTANNVGYAFDNNGNMTSKIEGGETTTYIYDTQNRMIKVELPDGGVNEFGYDGEGKRTRLKKKNGSVKKYVHDIDNVLFELGENNSTFSQFTSNLSIDSWISMSNNFDSYYYHKDGLNSTVNLSNIDEIDTNSYSYDVFGNIQQQNITVNNPFTYTGRVLEDEIELYFYRARFYDTKIGQFLSRDPIRATNPYWYVNANPLNFIDPWGTWAVGIGLSAAIQSDYAVSGGYQLVFDDKGNYAFISNAAMGVGSPSMSVYATFSYYDIDDVSELVGGELSKCIGGSVNGIGYEQCKNSFTLSYSPKWASIASPPVEIHAMVSTTEFITPVYNIYEQTDELSKIVRELIKQVEAGIQGKDKTVPTNLNINTTESISIIPKIQNTGHNELLDIEKFLKEKEGGLTWGCAAASQGLRHLICPNGQNIFSIFTIRPLDPNEIIPPSGYSESQWMSKNDNFNYKVLFENDPDFATAPAQKVVITLPLDEHLNPYSLRISDFGFGDYVFEVPENTIAWSQRVDVVDSLGVFVDVTAGLDVSQNEAFWIFESIDPATNLASTVAVDGGFLPVNDTLIGNGEGFVTFTISPSNLTVTGDSITAQANILFDTEEVIKTNIGVNLIDAVAPTSTLLPLPEHTDTTTFIVEWTGVDDTIAVGVSHYELYVSKDSEAFYLYQSNIDTIALAFTGEEGSDYAFFTRAIDNVGNKESLKENGEYTIAVKKDLQLSPKITLQGAYETSENLMRDNLRSNTLIPLTEPYTAFGFIHIGNSKKTTTQSVFDITGNDAIVDWVFLELRDKSDATLVKFSRSALLQRDGDIVDVDGISPVAFTDLPADDYYLLVRHRNHLGVMSASPISISRTVMEYDFTNNSNNTFGNLNGIADLGDGTFGLYSGDFNQNGQIQNTDYSAMVLTIGIAGYVQGDFDLNSQVQNTDVQLKLLPNIGKGQQFPQ